MRGIVVSVGFGDLLSVTLPRNARHLSDVMVVTDDNDQETQAVVKSVPNARLFTTDLFYQHGATFNKGLALEAGLDAFGRYGWMMIWDADMLLPPVADVSCIQLGNLYTPKRRLLVDVTQWREDLDWSTLPLKEEEFAGYCQIFHASDQVLERRPWYGTDWKHAGGCDSVFQLKWPDDKKIRPPFEVLHLGLDGQNWWGRATRRLDGVLPPEAAQRRALLQQMYFWRRKKGHGYKHEKLS